jgi:hypothetical protein
VKRWCRRVLRVMFSVVIVLLLVIGVQIAIGWRCNLEGPIHPPIPQPPERKAATSGIRNYARPEDDTFLSYPEWYIVWSYEEKADFQQSHLPSGFPYLGAVRQYWSGYCCISRLTREKYGFNGGEQLMLAVIGSSFSAEYILKGAYENTIGRVSEWSSNHEPTEEDRFASKVARDYADFVHVRPFYEFHFARQVKELWSETHLSGSHILRKWERKLFLTTDYTIEAFYCWLIEKMTHLTYGLEPSETYAWIDHVDAPTLNAMPQAKIVKQVGTKAYIVNMPRYQEFTTVASAFAEHDIQFVEIAGNSQILVSFLAPQPWRLNSDNVQQLFSAPLLTRPNIQRVLIGCDVPSLSAVQNAARSSGVSVEHIYDY